MKIAILAALAASTLAVTAAQAATPITYDFTFSGVPNGNTASFVGRLTLDQDTISQAGSGFSTSSFISVDGVLKETPNSVGQVFGSSSFGSVIFSSPDDLATTPGVNLVGTILASNGCAYGTSIGTCGNGSSGDFNLFGSPLNGTYYFQLGTPLGDLALTNLSVAGGAVPEPATWALMISGFGMVGLAMRRRSTALTA